MKQDYYKEIIKEIKELINTNPEEAIKKLEIELNMPYVPEKYEIQFIQLLDDIKYKIKQDANINNELSRQDVLDILFKNDKLRMPMAIAKLKDLNLRAMMDDIQKIISSNEISNVIKTIIYEYCVEQEIDFNLKWNNKLINPKIVGSTIQLLAYQQAYLKIEQAIIKNPSLQKVAHSFLELYALNRFPEFIDEKSGLGEVIISIAYESMGIPEINGVNRQRVKEVKQYLKS
ncbi:hypothetical protein MYMA111404_00650 [Mycoplasma marinum]|uniref:Uncharacterized protein n=1 Tax=Mycoplasma marinum TaxID=1937190 RepID=A0A4R0XV71_9MOLU|nr:hypothetical protein [Mycoplasma marinum]TCG11619.1 hypothetical protein C4B24_01470 [Mycoplasma marinum]